MRNLEVVSHIIKLYSLKNTWENYKAGSSFPLPSIIAFLLSFQYQNNDQWITIRAVETCKSLTQTLNKKKLKCTSKATTMIQIS